MPRRGYRFLLTALLYLALFCGYARATDYYVDNTHPRASDSNPGSESSPWLTIQKAAATIKAGDTCFINPGTYDERVRPFNSGKPEQFVTFKAVGKVVVRGFHLGSVSFVRLIGFEITQTAAFSYPAVLLMTAHYCQLLDNDIHHTTGLGIFFHKSAPSNNVLIRGNRLSYIGSVPGRETGEIAIHVAGNGNVVEYNDISRVADFTNVWGERNILRNNYFNDNTLSDFPDFLKKYPQGHHIDGLQYYSHKVGPLFRTLVENNFVIDNDVPHAHVILLRNIYDHDSSELIFRGNLVVRNGAIAIMAEAFPNFRIVQNTFVDMVNQQTPKSRYCFQFTRGATGAKIFNNILVNSARSGGMTFYVDGSSQSGFQADNNLIFQSGNPAQRRGVAKDPKFANPERDDYRLQNGSPAVAAGGPLTATAGPGNGRSIPVLDAGYFIDGWNITDGDLIQVGSSVPLRIVKIDYGSDVIEVDREIAWKPGEGVRFAHRGNAPDIGAFEYRPEGYKFGIQVTSPASGSSISGPVRVNAEVANEACVRFVVFSVAGIPMAQVSREPYSFIWDPTGKKPGAYKVEARAYARFPDKALTQSSETSVRIDPSEPSNGR